MNKSMNKLNDLVNDFELHPGASICFERIGIKTAKICIHTLIFDKLILVCDLILLTFLLKGVRFINTLYKYLCHSQSKLISNKYYFKKILYTSNRKIVLHFIVREMLS